VTQFASWRPTPRLTSRTAPPGEILPITRPWTRRMRGGHTSLRNFAGRLPSFLPSAATFAFLTRPPALDNAGGCIASGFRAGVLPHVEGEPFGAGEIVFRHSGEATPRRRARQHRIAGLSDSRGEGPLTKIHRPRARQAVGASSLPLMTGAIIALDKTRRAIRKLRLCPPTAQHCRCRRRSA